MESLDGYASLQLTAMMETATIVPDSVLPNNRFSMWIATGMIAYFTRFANGDVNPEYSFGCFIRPDKSSVWLQQTAFEHVAFDEHGKPAAWQQRWEAERLTLTAHSSIIPVPLSKAWGGAKVPQNLKENVNVPNAFDTEVTVIEHGLTRQLTGGGVYEYINTGKGDDPRQQSG